MLQAHPVPPRPFGGPAETARFLQAVETVEEAAAVADAAGSAVGRIGENLLEMQRIAEAVGEGTVPIEDRETEWAKIHLLAEKVDRLASAPLGRSFPPIDGTKIRFSLPGDREGPLDLHLPNLRARGPGSLALFETVDGRFASVGPGGRVLAGAEVEPDGPLLPLGRYQVELTYLATDGSDVRVRLLGADGSCLAERGANLSGSRGVEVDLGVGLALTLDRVPRSAEPEVGSTTVQALSLSHERGERLASLEGWLADTVQSRDYELYALFLEGPLGTVRDATERLERFASVVEGRASVLLAQLGPALDRRLVLESLRPGAAGWNVFDRGALLDVLVEEP